MCLWVELGVFMCLYVCGEGTERIRKVTSDPLFLLIIFLQAMQFSIVCITTHVYIPGIVLLVLRKKESSYVVI